MGNARRRPTDLALMTKVFSGRASSFTPLRSFTFTGGNARPPAPEHSLALEASALATSCQNGRVTAQKRKCPLCSDRGFLHWKQPSTTKVCCPRCPRTSPKRADSTERAEQILNELLAKERTSDV
jgi:hypothetical protein